MANAADENGTDVEIYVKALTSTIHADTPTGAPAHLHDLLDELGLERHAYPRGRAPLRVARGARTPRRRRAEAPGDARHPALLTAGYQVNCTPDVFDEAVYRQAVRELRAARTRPADQRPAPPAAATGPAPSRPIP
ncbi:hypothetical protein ACFU99_12015 [Streptomyces sp. NPDC057654]|uniref:hypothetical protein n=1 Tax=Streptomyces sp. NPDC057654 TaxID=3346196 RepID=UPI00368DDAB2